MNTRFSKSVVTFSHPFHMSGYSDELPKGDYEVIVEEELLQGLSFLAYRRTGTYLTVQGKGSHAGNSETREITEKDLESALNRDRFLADNTVPKTGSSHG